MNMILKSNELNQLPKNTLLFRKGDRISFIGMIIRGSIRIQNKSIRRSAKAGEMIALADLFSNEYLSDYITEEDTIFYAFPAFDSGSLESFLNSNYDYRGIVVDSVEKELVQYLDDREELLNYAKDFYWFLKKHYETAEKEGMNEAIPQDFLAEAPEDIFGLECEEEELSYYRECTKVPLDIKKKFYYSSDYMALYQAEEISYIIKEIELSCLETVKYIKEMYGLYINPQGTGLFDQEVRFAKEMKKNGKFRMEQFIRINDTKEKIYAMHEVIKSRIGEELPLNKKNMEDNLSSVLNTPMGSSYPAAEEVEVPREDPLVVLQNSLKQILDFAEIEEKKQKEIIAVIDAFVKVGDRLSTKDDVRKIKKQITGFYYELYKKCLFRWFENANVPLAIKLFLYYGYMDERLLDKEQILFLSDMVDVKEEEELPIKIYYMAEWLKEIYEGRKETSRDSFERDYRDALREDKRAGKISESQERQYLTDNKRKVIFEIDNMFTSNNKIVNGKLSTYVPILYKDQFYGDIERLYLTKKHLSDTVIDLEAKDFSVFYREVLYTNPDLKIEREYVMKRVYPDIILAPVYGTTSSMWQEITGKKRDTPARFIFSVFTEDDVEKSVIKAFGRFHWEYCRCEQGASWNNIQYKSLTSEYMDYIQYYRKNHDLTEEKREKIRTQIQRARNNSREIFLSDYEMWMNSESKSALKLNKVSRQILATYCPFNKEIREFLKTNAAFAEAMARQQRNYSEKAREWELRIRKRENNNLEVPVEFLETYKYYTEK